MVSVIQVCELASNIRMDALILLASCMTYTTAVFTVKNSWWWTEELSEICRVLFQKEIWEISTASWFYCKNLSWCMVTWTSKSFYLLWYQRTQPIPITKTKNPIGVCISLRSVSSWYGLYTRGQLSPLFTIPSLSLSLSHSSPRPSLSVSSWSLLATLGQLSLLSWTPSLQNNQSFSDPLHRHCGQ